MIKKYYSLKSKVSDIGYSPQSEGLLCYDNNDLIMSSKVGMRPMRTEVMPPSYRVKFTDFFHPVRLSLRYGLLISDEVLDVFSRFNIPKIYSYKVDIANKRNKKTYNHIIFDETVYGDINLKKTVVSILNYTTKETRIVALSDLGLNPDMSRVGELCHIDGEVAPKMVSLSLKPEFELDLFSLGVFHTSCMVSERLKNAIEIAGVTGIKFIADDFVKVLE